MKYISACKVLLFIHLLYLHCLPNYCDIKQDATPSEDIQTHKVLSADSSKTKNVPSEQNEIKKASVVLENSQKENVQPNVEYVYSASEEKDIKQSDNRNEEIESPHVSPGKSKPVENNLKSSRLVNNFSQLDSESEHKQEKDKPAKVDTHKTVETEPLSPNLVTEPQGKKVMHEIPAAKLPLSNTPLPSHSVTNIKATETHAFPTMESDKLGDDATHQQYDGMPSFDEWKKMMLAEQEKGGQKAPSPIPPGKKISSQKRRRNYSSYECGAKIVAANSEAEGTSRILNELVDEYMLNPCKAKIWFVIELCETVQASQIELSNFELFSSCPKEFTVYSSDNFPTRDWVPLGTFMAAEQRVLQSFALKQEGFGKFIKIELLSHYGEEHYCPLSVVRIFGTSMVDEYEEMETLASHPDIPDDDLDRLDIPIEDKKSTNIFGSATDAVMNIVKKAAQALGQQTVDEKSNDTASDPQNVSDSNFCNLMDSSKGKCKDIPLKSKDMLSALHHFSLSPGSMPQTLFKLLHRCDQCVSSRILYYSSAQPHCRFFQAALGPVVFQTLCDWFKEHPLAIAHESPAPGKKMVPSGTFIVSPTKSPPPQIMRIPSESDLTLKNLLNDTLTSGAHLDKSVTVNITTVPLKANKSAPIHDKVTLQSSIEPTHTIESAHSIYNESIKTMPGKLSKKNITPSADSVSGILTKSTVAIPEKTEPIKETVTQTATVTVSDYSVASELLTEMEEDQINEFLSDSNNTNQDDLSLDIIPATELPTALKSGEGKGMDGRNENLGKLEPVPAAGSTTTAGQKESVFMRMSNRIKALEINMSLSSLYLQELSQRYRRQMEEMQKAFNRTIGTLNDTARKAAEKDLKQQEILNSLQLQVLNLTELVEFLLTERSLIFRRMLETHVGLMVIEAIIMITIMSLCVRRINPSKQNDSAVDRVTVISPSRLSKRRNSADSASPAVARKVKKRSNSEENLNSEEVLIVEPLPPLLDPMLKAKKKNRKRNKGIQRSASNPSVERKNSTSLCPGKPHIHSDGCVLSNVKSKQSNKAGHTCENCDMNNYSAFKFPVKERRMNHTPLQNLTNGSVLGANQEKRDTFKGKEKFSFKKFLKFQKRDSI